MRTTFLFLSLIATAALFAGACDRSAAPVTSPVDQPIALLDGEEAEATVPAAELPDVASAVEETGGGESDPEPLSVAWTDGADTAAAATLSFTITNVTTDQIVAFSVSAVSKSIIGDGELDLGGGSLAPGESTAFSIAAKEIPVRSEKVVSQLFVKISRSIASATGGFQTAHRTGMRFYRHTAELEEVRAYTDEALMSELGGALFDSPASAAVTTDEAVAAEILGDKASSGGKRVQVSLATSGLVSYDEHGNVTGVMSFVGTGAGDASGEGAIVTPEEEPTADEMEASDE